MVTTDKNSNRCFTAHDIPAPPVSDSRKQRAGHQSLILAALALICAVPATWAAGPPCAVSQPPGLIGSALGTNFQINSIDVKGNYAYAGDWTYFFRVYDLTNPCAPALLTSLPTTQEMDDVAVSGANAYLANDANGLVIYDISDPAHPVRIAGRNDGAYAHNIFYNGGAYAWVGYLYSGNLGVYNVSGIPPGTTIPIPVIKSYPALHVEDIAVDQIRNRAYVLISEPFANPAEARLEILDITNLDNPVTISELTLGHGQYGSPGEIRVSGNYIFLSDSPTSVDGGLRVIDISNELAPSVAASYNVPNLGGMPFKGSGLAVDGNRAYIAGIGATYVFDIQTPANPSLISTLPLPSEAGNAVAGHIEIRDGLAYVTVFALDPSSKGGIAIYKLPQAGDQTITFEPLPNRTFGDPPFTVNAAASSSLSVSFAAAGACTVAGNTVTLRGAGICTITASQSGNGDYGPAPSVAQSFTIALRVPVNQNECKSGGWQWLGRANGSAFRNQGDCIQYVNTGK